MKKKFKNLSFFFLLITFLSNYSWAGESANGPQCYDLFKQIKNEWREKDLWAGETENFFDYGFEVLDEKGTIENISIRSKTNHLIVGQITDPSIINKIKVGDIIISIGDQDTSLIKDEDNYSFFDEIETESAWYSDYDDQFYKENEISELDGYKVALVSGSPVEQVEKVEVKLKRNGKEIIYDLPKLERTKFDETVFTRIKNISKINIKDSTFTVKLSTLIDNYIDTNESYDEEDRDDAPYLGSVIIDNLIFKDDEGDWTYTVCNKVDRKVLEDLRIPLPGADLIIENTTSLNQNLINSYINIEPWSERIGDDTENEYAKIAAQIDGTYIIRNDFKLNNFPFDRQKLKIIYSALQEIDEYEISHKYNTYGALEYFIQNQNINGWDIIGYDLYNEIVEDERNTFISRAVIELDIERQHGYYIYKVIIPILLILMVCWSVVWVDPKELEARLTITIVCLLSLIAYNFVIDSELPKLEYLTVMDWIILISYVYATIPNFLSVISFKLYKSNRNLSNKIEKISKRYGATSYIFLIIMIVIINGNLNPEYSSSMLSWFVGRS